MRDLWVNPLGLDLSGQLWIDGASNVFLLGPVLVDSMVSLMPYS